MAKGDAADPQEMFIPPFEALHWAVSLTDRLGRRFVKGREHGVRDGIKFVRNSVGHEWARAFELKDVPFRAGLVITSRRGGSRIVAPPVVKAWCWCDAAKLPEPKRRGLGPQYVQWLQGRRAIEALNVIAGALDRIRKTP